MLHRSVSVRRWAGWWIAGVRDPSDSNRRLKESERLFLLLGHEDPACAMWRRSGGDAL